MCYTYTIYWGCPCRGPKYVEVNDCPKWDIEGGCEDITSSDTDTESEYYDCMKARQAHEAAIFWGLIDPRSEGGTSGN
jgi:hypothetical protein